MRFADKPSLVPCRAPVSSPSGADDFVYVIRKSKWDELWVGHSEKAAKITYPDGSVKDVNKDRVKEYVPNTHPLAPPDKLNPVKFPNPQPGSKGCKRDPTPEDLKEAGL